jgi:hypothetical protein
MNVLITESADRLPSEAIIFGATAMVNMKQTKITV